MLSFQSDSKTSTSSKWLKTFLAVTGAIGIELIAGTIEAQSAVLLPQLKGNDTTIPITREQESWIAALGTLACPFTSIICGPLMDLWGRKLVFKIFYAGAAIGYLVIALSKQVYHLYIGRIFLACSLGFTVANVIYLPEICTTKQRSIVLSTIIPLFSFGLLFCYIIGGYLPWTLASMIFSIISMLGFISVVLLPESPAWLVKKKRIDEAKKTFQWLGRNDAKIETDIARLQTTGDGREVKSSIPLRLFFHPTVWKPFLILVLFHLLQTLTGIYNLMFYTVEFFEDLGTIFDPLLVTVGLASARFFVCCTVGLYFTTKCKRKLSTAVSGFGAGLAYTFAILYDYKFSQVAVEDRQYSWIPVVCTLASNLISTAGVQPLPWIMTGEMYPLTVRGIMGGATFFMGNIFLFLSIKLHFVLKDILQTNGMMILFAVSCFLSGLFGVFVLPETQGKTMVDIERGFIKPSELDKLTKVELNSYIHEIVD